MGLYTHLSTKPTCSEHPQCAKPCERQWLPTNGKIEMDPPSQTLLSLNNNLHFYCAFTPWKVFLQTFVLSTPILEDRCYCF